jgi:predicted metalloprotease with PDZ domain
VAEASFDAWIKYYRSDENTPNATISYYAKGSLVALALDLSLRGGARASLDRVMQQLWRQSGGGPIDEADILAAVRAVAGPRRGAALEAALHGWVHGTDDLPLQPLLSDVGVRWQAQPPTLAQRWGLRVSESALTGVKVAHVLRGGAAERAGLAPGDELLAVDDWRLRRLEEATALLPASGRARLLVARDQRVLTLAIAGGVAAGGAVQLLPEERTVAAAGRRRKAWLHG